MSSLGSTSFENSVERRSGISFEVLFDICKSPYIDSIEYKVHPLSQRAACAINFYVRVTSALQKHSKVLVLPCFIALICAVIVCPLICFLLLLVVDLTLKHGKVSNVDRKEKKEKEEKSNRGATTDTTDGKTQTPLWTLPRENQDGETPREVEEEMRTPKNATMGFEKRTLRTENRDGETMRRTRACFITPTNELKQFRSSIPPLIEEQPLCSIAVAVKIPKVEIPIGQNPGSRNPERSKSRTGQNPEGSKSRTGQNPEGWKSRMGQNPEGSKPRIG
ncbi:hypothetical protein M513_12947 [Trichuris suis]|uniref:Uncharacterized protein n=1 Tax=Trichuris suis TaxID=68888 RepID=A0A085LMH7_9BILA|nr:hypothetical protein M513_12947 [Trichuris suis]